MAADIVKQGYVKFQSKNLGTLGVWNRKWLLLRRQSGKGPVRLEKYKDEETASVMSIYGANKKIIDLTRVDRLERLSESVKKHGISIHVDASNAIQFCVGSEMEAESWLSSIRDEMHPENRQTHESFSVYMLTNDYMSTPGDCTLQLTRDSLRLLDRSSGRELTSWPLSGLRRFGVERNMFTFEAGSSCPSGSGTYFFSGGDSEFIYQRIQSLSQALSRTSPEGNTQSTFSMSNWGNISSIQELGNRRGSAGRQPDQENAYIFDTTMPTPRPPPERLNNSVQRHPGPSTQEHAAGGRRHGDYDYSELPADVSSAGHNSTNRRQDTQYAASSNGVRASASRSNGLNASASSQMHVRGINGGPYYAVSRTGNHNNQAANQASLNGSGRGPMEGSSRALDSPTATGAGLPRDSARSTTADGRIRAVRVEGDYYAVTRGTNPNTQQERSASDLTQLDQTNEQVGTGSGRISASSVVGQEARTREESPYYAVSEMNGSTGQDDDDDGTYSVPPIRPGGPRPVRR